MIEFPKRERDLSKEEGGAMLSSDLK